MLQPTVGNFVAIRRDRLSGVPSDIGYLQENVEGTEEVEVQVLWSFGESNTKDSVSK